MKTCSRRSFPAPFCSALLRCAALGVGLILGPGAAPSWAQAVTPVSVIEALQPEKTGPTVRALQSNNALQFQPGQPLPDGYDFPTVSVSVLFQDDTHILTAQGMRSLRAIAVALQDPTIQGQVYQVAAHVFSDGLGSAQFPVSTRRAQAVVDHLSVFYDIPRETLFPVGYGATRPLNMAAPYSPENTRIELINVSNR